MTTRYTDGPVTITLDDGFARALRQLASEMERATLDVVEAEAERIAAHARAEWYGDSGVEKETGLSGDIRVVTTIKGGEAIVTAGSTDTRTAGKKNAPVPAFVRSPSRLSLVKKQVTHTVYWSTQKELRANYHPLPANPKTGFPGDPPGSGPFILASNPKASDGKLLLAKFIRKPAHDGVGNLVAKIEDAVGKVTRG